MSYGGESEARRLGAIGRGEPRALCNRQHDGVNDDGMGYFVVSHDGGAFAPEPCKDCEWVRQLRERRP